MGQQQLLLIVLGVIIVGISVVVGINIFRANAIDQKREVLISDAVSLVPIAQNFYWKPKEMAGGSRNFAHWKIPKDIAQSYNGSFELIQADGDIIEIIGTGTEIVTGNDSIKIRLYIYPKNFSVQIIN